MSDSITFADLEGPGGNLAKGSEWPLEIWYEEVRNIPIADLASGDVAKAIRQNVWLEQILPRAVEILKSDPAAGDKYEGELVVALSSVPPAFWKSNTGLSRDVSAVVYASISALEEDVRQDADELLLKLRSFEVI